MLWALVVFAVSPIAAQRLALKQQVSTVDFPLVYNGKAAPIIISTADFKVAHIAAADLGSDIEEVTGIKPVLTTDTKGQIENVVIIGTLGKSPLIDAVVNSRKLDVSRIRGKWESYIIGTVERPMPNVRSALLIVGSDRRGTAFGVYEVSQMIGVSPWHWWADATPKRKTNLIISRGTIVSREPSVKYRGIFINDEDWGLQPWAAKTFEPETGNIGPKTYAKVFELLLRLKANTLWPAMHEVTKPFNSIPANRQVADDYAIVMGSSHSEPMLRNNVGEWKADKDAYNFITNPDGVTSYWEDRLRENGKFENIYTLGMRGIHDSPIMGTKSQAERIPLLEKIFTIQRGLIAKHVDANVETVPQIFCPYKEVLADYRAGLKVPDDVTIVFPDDNFGYIRGFPSEQEKKRKGGLGVYYHISYLGRPLSYLWLNSSPPALIWEEMNKAYENGMRRFWIVNVGDIKPAEIGMEFFLQMAYDANRWTLETQHDFLRQWAAREFGNEHAVEIAEIMNEYYRLGFQRKPEHLQWYLPGETPRPSELSGYEKGDRLNAYTRLRTQADVLFAAMPTEKKDEFYELVAYPVRSAASANERFIAAEMAMEYRMRFPETALYWAKRSVLADAAITSEVSYFNESLASGKWRHAMSPEMNSGQWPSMRSTPPRVSLTDFSSPADGPKTFAGLVPQTPDRASRRESNTLFSESSGVVSIEAEHFLRSTAAEGFSWRVIEGLGKTEDSVSVFPARARSFDPKTAPYIEFEIDIEEAAEFDAQFYLIPTQPLVPGNGLRIAFSIDGGEQQIVVVDNDTEVSSRKWAQNILDETTIGSAKTKLTSGRHKLRVIAIDTGIVLDKIVLASRTLPESYFGPVETRFERLQR